jgi:hypothetical protein
MMGLSVPQEYVCLDLVRYTHPLSVLLSIPGSAAKTDVTNSHLFLGYMPLIIALPFSANDGDFNTVRALNRIQLTFMTNESISARSVAYLELNKIAERIFDEKIVLFFEATFGQHSFLNSFRRLVNRLNEKRRVAPSTNINLRGNLYDQVRIAYAVPRVISIITVSDGSLINMFPTDLHGPIGEKYYCSSLRIGGKANDQVQTFKKIVVSEVNASLFSQTYRMGKNHMQDLQRPETFLNGSGKSESFNFPLPEDVKVYRELRQLDSLDHGIHRIHFYEVVNHHASAPDSTLAHIHQYFAQWRLNKGLPTDMLLR